MGIISKATFQHIKKEFYKEVEKRKMTIAIDFLNGALEKKKMLKKRDYLKGYFQGITAGLETLVSIINEVEKIEE